MKAVIENGKIEAVELEPVVYLTTKALSDERAEKYAKGAYKNVKNLMLTSVDVKEEVRGMSLENSDIVTRPASQQK